MTTSFVADSSLAIAWFVPSQRTEESDALLTAVDSGLAFFVPVLWTFEVANVLLSLRRRQRLKHAQYELARENLAALRATVDEEGTGKALGAITELADIRQLTVYDATYLELAMRRSVPLASRDNALNKAARASGVRTLL